MYPKSIHLLISHPNDLFLALGGQDSSGGSYNIRVLEFQNNNYILDLALCRINFDTQVNVVRWSPSGLHLMAGSEQGNIRIFTFNGQHVKPKVDKVTFKADAVQKQGFGQALLGAAVEWFSEQGVRKIEVATQGHNVSGQRIYQRNGFLTRSVEIWYHRWFRRGV